MISLSGYTFKGPFAKIESLPKLPGVFVVMDFNPEKLGYRVIDVGEADNMRSGVQNSDKKDNWNKEAKYSLRYATFHIGSFNEERHQLATSVGHFYNPPCWKGRA